MHIGIDLDNTLAELIGAAHNLYNITHPDQPDVPREVFGTWNAGSALGLSNSEFFKLLDDAWYQWDTLGIDLIEEDAAQTIELMRRYGHTIHIISNRSYVSHPHVAAWLNRGDIPYDVLTLTDMGKIEKLEFPIDVLIDDHPNLVERAEHYPYKMVLLYTQPWNAGLLENRGIEVPPAPGNIKRVADLKEASEFIFSMSR